MTCITCPTADLVFGNAGRILRAQEGNRVRCLMGKILVRVDDYDRVFLFVGALFISHEKLTNASESFIR